MSGRAPVAHEGEAEEWSLGGSVRLAVVELVRALDELRIEREAGGVPDTVFTVGKLFTDPAHHAMTKVPGRCDFTLNFGGTTRGFLDECQERKHALAERIGRERRVAFDLGECVGSDPTPLDPGLRGRLGESCASLGLPMREFATVGHDASIFARDGVPNHPRCRPPDPGTEHNLPLPALARHHTGESHQPSTRSG